MIENGISSAWPEAVVVYTDGASRGNPGPAAIGFVVQNIEGEMIYEQGRRLDVRTNNYAEYLAVVEALKLCVQNKVDELHLRSDSELLIRQLQGRYKVKSENIRDLFLQCQALLKQIKQVKLEHVRRENNERADELGNMALDSD